MEPGIEPWEPDPGFVFWRGWEDSPEASGVGFMGRLESDLSLAPPISEEFNL